MVEHSIRPAQYFTRTGLPSKHVIDGMGRLVIMVMMREEEKEKEELANQFGTSSNNNKKPASAGVWPPPHLGDAPAGSSAQGLW